jgi:hypothetical protein
MFDQSRSTDEQFDHEMAARHQRPEFVMQYAWAVPTERALDVLVGLGPIVEVGAGGGYWAMLLRERGVDVVAYDREPELQPAPYENRMVARHLWTDVLTADVGVAASHPDRTLFLCWPPYNTTMALDALAAYLGAGGTTLAYAGEDEGGCNGDDAFFQLRDLQMIEDNDLLVTLPQWPGLHDYFTVHRVR